MYVYIIYLNENIFESPEIIRIYKRKKEAIKFKEKFDKENFKIIKRKCWIKKRKVY